MVEIHNTMDKHNITKKKARLIKFTLMGVFLITTAVAVKIFNPIAAIVNSQLAIREGSLLFHLFKKPPIDVYFKTYIFNITNAEAYMNGTDLKLKFEEIGPYVYQEILEHVNYTFHSNNDTLTYHPKRTTVFIPELSVGDPTTDIVTVPNLVLLGAASVAADMSMFAAFAFNTFTSTIGAEPILNLTVQDYLWGYHDPLVKIGATILPNVITFDKFGMLDRMLDEGDNLVEMHLPKTNKNENVNNDIDSGVSEFLNSNNNNNNNNNNNKDDSFLKTDYETNYNYMDDEFDIFNLNHNDKDQHFNKMTNFENKNNDTLIRDYSILSYNGQTGLNQWGYVKTDNSKNTPCNTLTGVYDGTLFPKKMSTNETYRYYRKAFCRSLPIKFHHAAKLDGVDAYYFELIDNVFNSDVDDPNTGCFCKNKKCLKKGLSDITPCYYNFPVAVSYPHFHKSDPTLLEAIDGMKPNASKHESVVVIQPDCGVPIRVSARVQLNLLVGSSLYSSKLNKFKGSTLPIIWIELSVTEIRPSLKLLLQFLFIVLPYAHIGIICVLSIIGVSVLAIAALGYFCIPQPNQTYNPKRDIRYSAIYMFPYIKRELEKCVDDEPNKIENV